MEAFNSTCSPFIFTIHTTFYSLMAGKVLTNFKVTEISGTVLVKLFVGRGA